MKRREFLRKVGLGATCLAVGVPVVASVARSATASLDLDEMLAEMISERLDQINYTAFVHPSQHEKLTSNLMKGEIGRYEGVRFVPQIPS
ncbi:MAG: twin-arginine translocation signal domain-containing protein [Planctomycetota bacterium]|jgi:hypothetical protein